MNLIDTGIDGIDRYCRQVMSGETPVCRYLKQAVDRHYRDLNNQKSKKFPFYFSPEMAEHFFTFCESLKHYNGDWAGKPLLLEDWQKFIYGSIFGWLSVLNNKRRFHETHIEIPKKNGKSIIGGAIALYGISVDDEPGAEVYTLATNRMQAMKLSYKAAIQMVENHTELKSVMKINKGMATMGIEYPANNSKFEPLTSKPKSLDGFNPHMAVNDETKDWDDMSVYDLIEDGIATRSQPLLYNVSTAGDNRRSLAYRKREYLISILNQIIKDDRFFGVIYTIDDEDLENWDTEESWRKANPNFGISIQRSYFERQVKSGRQTQRKKNDVLTKNLNRWISAFEQWMDGDAWKKCADNELTPDDFKELPCILALDLASKKDLAAMVLMFYDELSEQFFVFLKSYLPEGFLATDPDGEKKEYRAWADDGHIILTDGSMIDQDFIKEDVIDAAKKYDVRKIAYDPFQATKLVTELQKESYLKDVLLEYRHTVLNMSEPMKEIEAKVLDGLLHHEDNPVLNWMFSNVVAKEDRKENIYPNKKDDGQKIDGAVAAIMAMGAYLFTLKGEETDKLSPYARRILEAQKNKTQKQTV